VDTGAPPPAPGETSQVDGRPAADFKNHSAAIAVKVHEPEQVMQLFEVVLVEVVEETARTDRMPRDLEVGNVLIPVRANVRRGSHRKTISHTVTMAAA